MQAADVLKQAWAAVQESGVPEELHDTAFKEAVRLLTVGDAERGAGDLVAPRKDRVQQDGDPGSSSRSEENDPAAKFASESGLRKDQIDSVFYFAGEEVHLNGPARKLGSAKAQQMRTVAVALTAAYNFAFDVQSLSIEKVRAECERLKCFDRGNFNTVMSKISVLTYTGPAREKTLRVKSDTADALQKLVDEVLGVKTTE